MTSNARTKHIEASNWWRQATWQEKTGEHQMHEFDDRDRIQRQDGIPEIMAAVVRAGATRHVAAAVAVALWRAANTTAGDEQQNSEVEELRARHDVVSAGLEAHHTLNMLNGEPSHDLGRATMRAISKLSAEERRVLRGLRRKTNLATHSWPQQGQQQQQPSGTSKPNRWARSRTRSIATQTHEQVSIQTQPVAWYPVLVPEAIVAEASRQYGRDGQCQQQPQQQQQQEGEENSDEASVITDSRCGEPSMQIGPTLQKSSPVTEGTIEEEEESQQGQEVTQRSLFRWKWKKKRKRWPVKLAWPTWEEEGDEEKEESQSDEDMKSSARDNTKQRHEEQDTSSQQALRVIGDGQSELAVHEQRLRQLLLNHPDHYELTCTLAGVLQARGDHTGAEVQRRRADQFWK